MKVLKKIFNREDPFLIQFALLSLVGFWYIDSERKWPRAVYAVYRFLAVFSLTSLMFMEIVDIIMLSQDLSRPAERLCAATITCIITARTHLMLRYAKAFYDLEKKLTKFQEMKAKNPEDLKLIKTSSGQIVTAAKVLYVGAVFGVFFWSFHPKLYGDRKLPFPITVPIDTEKTPYYEILYVYLIIILIMFTVSVVATVLGFGSYLTIINAHFGILKRSIESIHREREEEVREKRFLLEFNIGRYTQAKPLMPAEREVKEKRLKDAKTMNILKEAIETQKFIYDEIHSFKRLHSKHFLVHITGILFGVVVVETTGLKDAFTIHLVKRFLILGLGVLDIFLICLFGEELQHKSVEITEALYLTPWHEMDIQVQKVILIMTIRSRRPCILKAGGTIRLDLATFLNIMRVAYNFVLLLRHTVIRNT